MEINITKIFNELTNGGSHDCSGSIMTHGNNAAMDTWNNSKDTAKSNQILNTPKEYAAFIEHMQAMGFGDDEEKSMYTWPLVELNALFIQLISGDINESDALENHDFIEYEKESEAGQVAGAIYKGDDQEIYYYLGS